MKRIVKKTLFIIGICLCLVIVKIGYKYYSCQDGLTIIGYHNVVSDEDKEKYYKNDVYTMAVSVFEQQMAYLADNQYHTLTLDEVNDWYEGRLELPEKRIVITFDDGFETFNTIVKPILQKYNLYATCFVIGILTQDHPDFYEYLKADELIPTNNVGYYSHSYNMHVSVDLLTKKIETMTKEEINEDFEQNKGIVDDTYFAYPFGRSSKDSQEVLIENNVTMGFGYAQNRRALRSDNKYLMPRFLMYSFMDMTWFKWWVN